MFESQTGYPKASFFAIESSVTEDTHLDEDAKQALAAALAAGRAVTREVRSSDGKFYSRTVKPYTSGPGGVMVTYEPLTEQSPYAHDQIIQSLAAGVAQIGVWTFDPRFGAFCWDERSARITGLEGTQAPLSEEDFARRIAPSDRSVFNSAMDAVIHNGTPIDLELRFNPPEGETIWLRMRGERTLAGGTPAVVCILADVSESEANKTRSDFMMRELDHRVNNLLAIILSIAEITARTNTDLSTYARDFRARLESMARTHSLLAQTQWSGPQLRALIEGELHAQAPKDCVALEGPNLTLSPSAAQTLAMLFHELAANAVKHGALSASDGQIDVSWKIGAGETPSLELVWQESGGPHVVRPEHDGFGGKVIHRIISRQLRADVDTQWNEDGIRLTAQIPLARIGSLGAA